MRFNFTKEDIARGTLVSPGEWYTVKISSYKDAVARTDGSKLAKFTADILDGEFKDVKLYWQFSEKAPGFAIPFAEALTGQKVQEGDDLDMGQNTVGKELQVYVVRGEYNGKPQNNVDGFRPIPS